MALDATTSELETVADPEEERLEGYAAAGLYPNVSPCPVGCKFCYERSLPEFYPKLKVARLKKRSLPQFEFYADKLEEYGQSAVPAYPVVFRDGNIFYHSASDFFAQGMSLEQIDRVVAANAAAGQAPYVSTMGKDFDCETARLLTERYPDAFRVRLSVLTFNDAIKRTLIPRWRDSDEMRKIVTVLRDAHIYLLHFNREQTLEDLRAIDALANREHRPKVGIAVVHYTRLHPPVVRQYAEEGFSDFESLVVHLMRHASELSNIDDIHFQHPAEAFTFRFRNVLRSALAPFALGAGDVVLCSRGAHQVMESLVVRGGARVVPVADGLGGSTSFTTTLCTADFEREIGKLAADAQRPIRRAFVPAPVWWVDGGARCLGGGSLDELRDAFPTIEIVPISVPDDVIESRLTIRQAYDYYNTDLAKTAALRASARSILVDRLDDRARVTDAGFVRRVLVSRSGALPTAERAGVAEAIDPERLDEIGEDVDVVVSYEELLVERSDETFPGDAPRLRVTFDGAEVPVRRALVRVFPLPGEARALFGSLFLEGRALDEVVRAIPEADLELRDLARSIHDALAELERAR